MAKNNNYPKPLVKWAGGKTSLIPQFERGGMIPKDFKNYIEPFFGGGAIFFNLYRTGRIHGGATLIDINSELINFYLCVKENFKELIDELNSLTDIEKYYDYRDEYNNLKLKNQKKIRRAGLLLFLNKTCFNGLYRENKKGKFNVPKGSYKNPTIYVKSNFNAVRNSLKNVSLIKGDFSTCLDIAEKGDFVYFDPPYMPLSETSAFTSYHADDFTLEDQKRLADIFDKLTNREVKVLLSNSHHGDIEALFKGIKNAHLNEVIAPRCINCKGDGRKAIQEYAITNYIIEKC